MTNQKIAIGLVAVALFTGVVTAHAANFSEGANAYRRGDYATAVRIYLQLANQGHTHAQNNLGLMYEKGHGVRQNHAEAVMWYRKAANQGSLGGQINLGNMYERGQGVTRDYAEAVRWYSKAAHRGSVAAQARLGFLYSKGGQGVMQDYVQAHMWYSLAVAKDDEIARKQRDRLAEKMTPGQLAEGQRLAREWKPNGTSGVSVY